MAMNQMTISHVEGVTRNEKATKNHHQFCSYTEVFLSLVYEIIFVLQHIFWMVP